MSSKYANLPDIDTTNPDVYETPDVPTSFTFGHDSDSEGDYGNESTSSPNAALVRSASGSNLMSAASRLSGSAPNGQAASDEAIDGTRLRPSEARHKFVKSRTLVSSSEADFSAALPGARRSRYSPHLLPEASVYSIHNKGKMPARGLSSTSRRQLRTQQQLLNGHNGLHEESETRTERLRRLRYEMEQLENELQEEEEDRKRAPGSPGQAPETLPDESAADEAADKEDSLPARDDADKTRPRGRRAKKKQPQVDQNGELSPAVLLTQVTRLKGDLDMLSRGKDNPRDESDLNGVDDAEAGSARRRDLVQQLQRALSPEAGDEQRAGRARTSESGDTSSSLQDRASTSRMDARLQLLEKYVGANEAEVEDARPLPPPLLSTLGKLEHQLHLLTQPRHLDTIARRVRSLVTDLERIHEARRKIGDTRPLNVALTSGITVVTGPVGTLPSAGPSSAAGQSQPQTQTLPPDALQKIDTLFSLLPRIEPLLPLAPHLVTRLRSLATLHTSSQAFTDDLVDIEGRVTSLQGSEGLLKELLQGVQDSFEDNQRTVKANMETLGNRVEDLLQRVAKLSDT